MGLITGDLTATIASGQSLSAPIYLGAKHMTGIQMPATWTAAALSFQGSIDNVTYQDLFDDAGAEVNFTVVQAHYVKIRNPFDFGGFLFLKVRSGLTGAPVVQVATRVITFEMRRLY